VGEVGGVAEDDADAGAALGAALGALHPRLVDRESEPGALLAEDLGEVAAVGERPGDDARRELRLDQVLGRGCHQRAASITRAAARNSSRPSAVSAE
jgi:hypothetical protein